MTDRELAIHHAKDAYWLLSRHGRNTGLELTGLAGQGDGWKWMDPNGWMVLLSLGGKLRETRPPS